MQYSGRYIEEALQVESDRRLFGCMGSGSVFGISLAVMALSFHVPPRGGYVIPGPLKPEVSDRPELPFLVKMPEDYHRPAKPKDPRLVKHPPKPGQPGSAAAKPKTQKPAAKDPGTLGTHVISSNSGNKALVAYDLLAKAVKNVDLDKLTEFGTLTRTDKTRLGGRLGRQTTEFNAVYDMDGTCEGNCGGVGIEMPRNPALKRVPSRTKGPSEIGKPVEIDAIQSSTVRSTASILAVIRSRSPGLRHLYNAHLKMRPGFAGKITLRFAIAPSGEVVDVGLAGSTTSAPEFDAAVMEKVMSWKFEAVKASGNDLVTVPFNFSE